MQEATTTPATAAMTTAAAAKTTTIEENLFCPPKGRTLVLQMLNVNQSGFKLTNSVKVSGIILKAKVVVASLEERRIRNLESQDVKILTMTIEEIQRFKFLSIICFEKEKAP
jgi:hypothetical protein